MVLDNLFSILLAAILWKLADYLFPKLFELNDRTFKGLHQKNENLNYFSDAIQTRK